MSKGPARKFDHDKAKRLRKQGWTYTAIAAKFDVSTAAVYRVCDEQRREVMALATAIRQRSGVCIDCGGQRSFNGTHERKGISKGRCRECAAKHAATSVRDDALQCLSCRQWLWDTAFPHDRNNGHRRGRHNQCTSCQTKARTEWRNRNRERENAYQREYKRRRRAEKAA